jgi:hypothetical protein
MFQTLIIIARIVRRMMKTCMTLHTLLLTDPMAPKSAAKRTLNFNSITGGTPEEMEAHTSD